MKINLTINDETIIKGVEEQIIKNIMSDSSYFNREAKYGVRDGVDKAIKQYIYNNKDVIIDRVVERASIEIVKKGLPKLLENLGRG